MLDTNFFRKRGLFALCETRDFGKAEYSANPAFELSEAGLNLITPVQIRTKSIYVNPSAKDIFDIHILRTEFDAHTLRHIMPQLQTFGVPVYIYSTMRDFKHCAVEYANSLPIPDEYKARLPLEDPVLDISAWFYLLEAATSSHDNLTKILKQPTTKHAKELIDILHKTKGASHAFLTLKSKIYLRLESVEEFGDDQDWEEVEAAQKLRELMSRQRLTMANLPKFLYMTIKNVSIRDHRL